MSKMHRPIYTYDQQKFSGDWPPFGDPCKACPRKVELLEPPLAGRYTGLC